MSQPTSSSVALLKALSYRISSTKAENLPNAVSQISSSLWNCRNILSTPTDSKQNNEASIVVYRFKTQLATLLQDRTVEGRWSAVVLVKATIEAGGVEVLSKSNAWVRILLGMLKKPDPPTTRSLIVLTLTRIFMLTWDYSNLVREITTPALTTFVPTCLANIENRRCSSSELQTVLEAFSVLLPRHPTIFRTNDAKLRQILTSILFSSQEGRHFASEHKKVANRLWVLLANCTPKNGGSEKWDETLKAAITAAHATSDRVFRSVIEDWQSTTGVAPPSPHVLNGDVQGEDSAGLPGWKGVYAGGERLAALLDVIASHLSTASPSSVSVRVGLLADLLTRLFSIIVPQVGKFDFVKPNNQISKDERDAMFAVLPKVHTAAIKTVIALQDRLGPLAIPCAQGFVDQIGRVYPSETVDPTVRRTLYDFLTKTLNLTGPTLSKTDFSELAPIIKLCCQDILPTNDDHTPSSSTTTTTTQPGINQQLGLAQTTQTHPTSFPSIKLAATTLLSTTLTRLNATCIPPKLRVQIDRTAVLVQSHDLLLASILNPSQKPNSARTQASLLPILARAFPGEVGTETLIRPRMPGIKVGLRRPGEEEEEDGGDEEEEEEEEVEAGMQEEEEPTPTIPNLQTGADSLPEPVYEHQEENTRTDPATAEQPTDALLAALAQDPPPPSSSYATAFTNSQAIPASTAEANTATPTGKRPALEGLGDGSAVKKFKGGEGRQEEEEDSGSDFEMPTLTAELSSDEED